MFQLVNRQYTRKIDGVAIFTTFLVFLLLGSVMVAFFPNTIQSTIDSYTNTEIFYKGAGDLVAKSMVYLQDGEKCLLGTEISSAGNQNLKLMRIAANNSILWSHIYDSLELYSFVDDLLDINVA